MRHKTKFVRLALTYMAVTAMAVTTIMANLFMLATVADAQCSRTDQYDLSSLAAEVWSDIQADSSAWSNSPVTSSRLLSTCNRFISLEIDGPNIFSAARDMIALADHEVEMAFFDWQDDSQASLYIGFGLIAAQVRRTPSDPLLVRILVDDVTVTDFSRVINRLYDSVKNWKLYGLDSSRVLFQFATMPRATQASSNFHDKYIIVDGTNLLITGANVQKHNDPAELWHDSGYLLEGDVSLSALQAFEKSWNHYETIHWECSPQFFSFDCDHRSHYPQPAQPWLPAFGSQVVGNIPVLAVGREKGSTFGNGTNNHQDIAWQALMEHAGSHIYIETPNINDDAFRGQIVDAVQRGVEVRLITGLGFNGNKVDLPSLGGSNLEVIGNLRKDIRAYASNNQHLFKVRWYGQDGRIPITDNGDGASHTKYLSVDSQVAMVGSGNQDTISWNIAHEFNVLIDDVTTTANLENNLFLPDWAGSVEDYAELYEGNNSTGDIVCPIFTKNNSVVAFDDQPWYSLLDTWKCNNDEARSILLHEVDAGRVLRFYDSPSRLLNDDWTEIVVKQSKPRIYISSFQLNYETNDVRVIYHKNNGLDGKISAAEVSTAAAGPVIDLYEGGSASQSLVCSLWTNFTSTFNLSNISYCDNDEARSLVLTQFPANKAVFIYDSPNGSTGDDWAVIVPKRTISRAVVHTFEANADNGDFRLCTFPHNGLNGKVSRVRVGSLSEGTAVCSGSSGGGGGGGGGGGDDGEEE